MDIGEIQETTDDIYGSISDATSPNEAMFTALSDGEIQVIIFTRHTANCLIMDSYWVIIDSWAKT